MSGWNRGTTTEQGYGWRWQRIRLMVLRRDKYLCQCAECKRTGRVRLANEVDHITPKSKGGSDALDNLQSIAHECHKAKTMLDTGARPKQVIGGDGWPVR